MFSSEKRPAVGIDIIGSDGPSAIATLYTKQGSQYVPIHEIPTPEGKVTWNGISQPHQGLSGSEIKWMPATMSRVELGRLFGDYIKANGWEGSPDGLRRLDLLK